MTRVGPQSHRVGGTLRDDSVTVCAPADSGTACAPADSVTACAPADSVTAFMTSISIRNKN